MIEHSSMRAGTAAPHGGSAGWIYRRPQIEGISELGIFDGSQGLAPHFHDELQISFVLSGQRAFRMGNEIIVLSAGQCACIEAGVPHQSLAGSPDLSSFNAYLPPGDYEVAALTADIEDLWKTAGCLDMPDLAEIVRRHRRCFDETERAKAIPIRTEGRESVGVLAKRMGQSRESFSRRFTERHGMPPHAFRLAARLNRARDLLRQGEAVAAVAVETGFADQSHFGRLFRRAFGCTPGRYRANHQI
ncbi:AraC family transcriptional regulator [Methyloferula stellata]|uniref:AraC family transcriptional regulator n=1 Tax=Methyloferula stellata TaxID=876270 RepID=UPI00036E3EDE|nr:helix-turn-helix domain-containing protein [Methyloferula stellata]